MYYRIAVTPSELDLIQRVRGKEIQRVFDDGWALFLECDDVVLRLTPEESATPDAKRPRGAVTRPRIDDAATGVTVNTRTRASDPGRISCATIFTTRLMFSIPQLEPAIEVRGVVIPEGLGYGPLFDTPSAIKPPIADAETVADIDVSIQLLTDSQHSLDFFTDGVTYFTSLGVDDHFDADWKSLSIGRRLF